MPMDAYRSGNKYVVHFHLPGVASDSNDLDVDRNVLTAKAERSVDCGENADVQVAEGPRGVLSRQLFPGDTLDGEHIQAAYDAGC